MISFDQEDWDTESVPETCVRTLLCHAHVAMALRCLSSLVKTSAEKISFIIHEDGTLTEEDAAVLKEKLPVTAIIRREEATKQVLPMLKNYPVCQRFREVSPLALKLLDIALLEKENLYYCDSDILFLRPHSGLFHGILEQAEFVHMADMREAYALRPWAVPPVTGLQLVSRLNSGLLAMRGGILDLDFLEAFLRSQWKEPAFVRRMNWAEQTCWAALAGRLKTWHYDSGQVAMANPAALNPKAVAVHFISSQRGAIGHFSDHEPTDTDTKPERVHLQKSKLATALDLLVSDVAVKFGRYA